MGAPPEQKAIREVPVAVVLPTCDRPACLAERSLPSIAAQTLSPARVVVVDDGTRSPDPAVVALAERVLAPVEPEVLANRRAKGAAGAWNTGLDHLERTGFCGFVALLDDDDTWDPEHLEVNVATAIAERANLVVSGLRLCTSRGILDRPLIRRLDARDFLVGNPGWQGSNTFVDLHVLRAAGGFRDGLTSTNDRDVAIRLLRRPDVRPALTSRWTATCHCDTPGRLSEPRSAAKREGLAAFWRLYGPEMSADEQAQFFDRAQRLFGVERAEITREAP